MCQYSELHKPEMWGCYYLQIVVCCGQKNLWGCFYAKFIAVPSFVCVNFVNVSVFPSLSYTNMHTPYCFCFGTNVYCLPTKYENLQGLHSIAQPSFVHVSLSISELYEHAYSHCSLLWCEKGIVYQQVSIGVISLSPTCLPRFIHPSI